MARSFIQSLAFIRSTDRELPEVISEVAENILWNWHNHGNKTPFETMQLAINGGYDEKGLFGEKGKTIKGVSKGLVQAFSGIKLGKRDPNANIEELVIAATSKGMQTKAEASEAAKKARAERAAKSKPTETAPEPITGALVLQSGAAIKLTPEECAALEHTLKALRSQRDSDTIDAETTVVADAAILLAA